MLNSGTEGQISRVALERTALCPIMCKWLPYWSFRSCLCNVFDSESATYAFGVHAEAFWKLIFSLTVKNSASMSTKPDFRRATQCCKHYPFSPKWLLVTRGFHDSLKSYALPDDDQDHDISSDKALVIRNSLNSLVQKQLQLLNSTSWFSWLPDLKSPHR